VGITPQNRNTWYQPLEEQADIDKAVHWVLGHPGIFLNTAGDVTLLPRFWMQPPLSKASGGRRNGGIGQKE